MSYDYEKTSLTLYRAVFKANYESDVGRYLRPDKELAEAAEVAPLLHPTFDSHSTCLLYTSDAADDLTR
ncbi:hypothetical protein FA227_28840, partial [Pseudomonas aeruginosa]|nr:hypothetical protein [Pseudomonas aeruginosa]